MKSNEIAQTLEIDDDTARAIIATIREQVG